MRTLKLFGLLVVLLIALTACPPPPPNPTQGVWDSSKWDSVAVWGP